MDHLSFNKSATTCLIVILIVILFNEVESKYFRGSSSHGHGLHSKAWSGSIGMRPGVHRISSGYLAKPGEFPSFVSLVTAMKLLGSHQVTVSGCGGVIVDEQTILTAAHCIQSDYFLTLQTQVRTGIKGFYEWHKPSEIYNAKEICISREWNDSRKFDFAAIRLDRPIEFSPEVQPVDLPIRPIKDDEQAYVMGVGYENELSTDPAIAKILPVSRVECSPEDTHETNICFRANNPRYPGDSCKGDSGGPVYAKMDGRQYVYGLVSYGEEECKDGIINTSVNSDVFRQLDLVRELINDCRAPDSGNQPKGS